MLPSCTRTWLVILLLVNLVGCAGLPAPETANTLAEGHPVSMVNSNIDKHAAELFARASNAIVEGDFATAEAALEELTQAWPDYSSPWTNLGIVYARTGRDEEARSAFAQAMTLRPDDCKPMVELALLARRQHQFREAEKLYQVCLESDPGFAAAALNLGILYELYLGQLPDALFSYERYQASVDTPDQKVSGWITELSRRIDRQVAAEVSR